MARLKPTTCHTCHHEILTGWIDGLMARTYPTLHTTQWAAIWKALGWRAWVAGTDKQPMWEWLAERSARNNVFYLQHVCGHDPPAIADNIKQPDPIDPPY